LVKLRNGNPALPVTSAAQPPSWLVQPVAVAKPKRRAAAAGVGAFHSKTISATSVPALAGGSRSPGTPSPITAADPDSELCEYLREWRRPRPESKDIAAFMVMHDTTLDELARRKPASLVDIRRVPGFGEKKTERYGQSVLEALAQFRKGARATPLERRPPILAVRRSPC